MLWHIALNLRWLVLKKNVSFPYRYDRIRIFAVTILSQKVTLIKIQSESDTNKTVVQECNNYYASIFIQPSAACQACFTSIVLMVLSK